MTIRVGNAIVCAGDARQQYERATSRIRFGCLAVELSDVLDFSYRARNELEVRAAESAANHAQRMAQTEATATA